jgi:hypothetical protein
MGSRNLFAVYREKGNREAGSGGRGNPVAKTMKERGNLFARYRGNGNRQAGREGNPVVGWQWRRNLVTRWGRREIALVGCGWVWKERRLRSWV